MILARSVRVSSGLSLVERIAASSSAVTGWRAR
jgi:hypothetical protein